MSAQSNEESFSARVYLLSHSRGCGRKLGAGFQHAAQERVHAGTRDRRVLPFPPGSHHRHHGWAGSTRGVSLLLSSPFLREGVLPTIELRVHYVRAVLLSYVHATPGPHNVPPRVRWL